MSWSSFTSYSNSSSCNIDVLGEQLIKLSCFKYQIKQTSQGSPGTVLFLKVIDLSTNLITCDITGQPINYKVTLGDTIELYHEDGVYLVEIEKHLMCPKKQYIYEFCQFYECLQSIRDYLTYKYGDVCCKTCDTDLLIKKKQVDDMLLKMTNYSNLINQQMANHYLNNPSNVFAYDNDITKESEVIIRELKQLSLEIKDIFLRCGCEDIKCK